MSTVFFLLVALPDIIADKDLGSSAALAKISASGEGFSVC
jgi:hypothetical protein